MTHRWALPTGRVGVLMSAVVLTFALTAVPVAASDAATVTTYTDIVLGIELPPGGGTGVDCSSPQVAPFFGGASGDLPGLWFALVPHTNLSTISVVCPGGQFGLVTQLGGQPAVVTGVFVNGLVLKTSSSCPGTQTFQVSATLALQASVGGQVRQGTGNFQNVTLIHLVDANCNPFFAIVTGPVSLMF